MPKRLDLTNQRFGRLVVKSFSHSYNGHRYWNCLCDCSTQKTIRVNDLRTGRTLSCGCLGKEKRKQVYTKHNMTGSPTFIIWVSMKQRCFNPNQSDYLCYGGRGITVCARWLSFPNFLEDMGERPKGLSLDRIDNDGNYAPENCRWATRTEQANNMRSNCNITVNNKTHTIAEWESIQGFSKGVIGYRIRHGWTPKKAIMTPSRQSKSAFS